MALAVLLAALLPVATETQPAGKAWFLSPRNAPLIGLAMMALPGLLLGLRAFRGWRAAGDRAACARRMAFAFRDLGPGLGYAALFCGYLFALPLAGFALSTLAFGQACLWLAGLRSLRWAGWNLLFAVVLVLVLRAGMGLWFPHAALFHWLPGGLGNAVSPYL
ncbi:hypothetical protein ACFOGJ_05250 [Marinibaculum pumilum]|uniref:Tripartite tricarboxylate transporter TctB family protein n=1 Tax=Marinibaculum pumilum TaxID=1766165 RepID=A0ABV7KWX7_9PROT